MLLRLLSSLLLVFAGSAHAEYILKIQRPATAEQAVYANQMRQTSVMTNLVELINKYVKTERDVPILARSCGQPNAFYIPSKREIVLCYEVMVESQKNLQRAYGGQITDSQLNQTVYSEVAFLLLHEVGHHLIHEYALPVLGREEDAADKIAAYVFLASGGESVLKRSVMFFATRSRGVLSQIFQGSHDYSDTHGLPQQRLANLVCWGYGKSPREFAQLTQPAKLQVDRLRRCGKEYQLMERDITALLGDQLVPTTRVGDSPAIARPESGLASSNSSAKTNQCMQCHKPHEGSVGPSLSTLAARYSDTELEGVLERKVRQGVQGVWGQVPAPPMNDVQAGEIKLLVDWIASYR